MTAGSQHQISTAERQCSCGTTCLGLEMALVVALAERLLHERSCWPHGQLGGWTVPVRCFLGRSDRRHDQQPSIAGTRAQALVRIGCAPLLAIKNL
jgi:hypothetical protein